MRQQKHGIIPTKGSSGSRPTLDQHSSALQYNANHPVVETDQGSSSSDSEQETSKASSILSTDPLKWIQSSHFSSTLDVGAIKETSTSTISAPLTTIAENWETEEFLEPEKFHPGRLDLNLAPTGTLTSESSSGSESDDKDNAARDIVDVDDDDSEDKEETDDESEDKETDEFAATDSDSESNDGSSSSSCSSDSSSDNESFQKVYSGRNFMVHRHETSKKSHGSFRKGSSKYSRSMKREREFYSSGHSYRTEDSSVLWNTSIASDMISFSNQKSGYDESEKISKKHVTTDHNVFHKSSVSSYKHHRQENNSAFYNSSPASSSHISNKKHGKSHRNYSNAPQGAHAFHHKRSNLTEDSTVQVGPKSIWEPNGTRMDKYNDKGYDLISHHTETVAKNKSYDLKWTDKRRTNYSSVESGDKYRSLFSRKIKKGLKKKVREHIDNANLSDNSVILLPKKENSSTNALETYSGDIIEDEHASRASRDVKVVKRVELDKIYNTGPMEAEGAIQIKNNPERDFQSSRFKNAVDNELPGSNKLLESLWRDRNMKKNDSKMSKMRISNSHNRNSPQDRSRVYIVDSPSSSPPYIANYNNSTKYDELSKNVRNLDSDDSDSTPPPILEPIISCCKIDSKGLRYHSYSNKESHRSKRRGRPKGSKNKTKVECASQTDHASGSVLQSAYPPPRLIGIDDDPTQINRGRPRKGPPVLVAENISKHSQMTYQNHTSSGMQLETHKNVRKKRKKGKLSVLLIAAKHWKSKQKSERGYKNVQSQESTVYYASSPERQINTVEEEIRKRDIKEIERKLFPSTFKKSMSHSKLHSKKKCRHRKLLNLKFKKHKTIIKSESESEDEIKIDSNNYNQLCAEVKREARATSPQESVISVTSPEGSIIELKKENTLPSMDVFKEIQPPTYANGSSEIDIKTQQRNQVQQMLSALAATVDPCDEVPKHKKEYFEIDETNRDFNTKTPDTSITSDISKGKDFNAKTLDNSFKPDLSTKPLESTNRGFGTKILERANREFSTKSLDTSIKSETVKRVFGAKSDNNKKVFDKKYNTLNPEPFWKKATVETVEEKTDRLAAATEYEKTPEGCGSRFMTKAYLKEIPPSHDVSQTQLITPKTQQRNQVQQMLSALAATDDTVAKVPKRKKELDRDTTNRDASYETPGNESDDDDILLRKRDKKSKGWRSKHKNVIDPVFLGEVEHLIQDISACKLEMKLPADLWPDRPNNCVPSIFRRRKVPIGRRKKDSEKPIKRVKSRQHSKDGVDVNTQSITPEANEQRLPLKKRHRHIEGDGLDKLAQQKTESTGGPSSTATIDLPLLKLLTTWDNKPTTQTNVQENVEKEKSMSDFYFKGALEKSNRKLTAADTIGEKLRIQNLIRSKDMSTNDKNIDNAETKIKSAFVNNIEECINKYTGSSKDATRQKLQSEIGSKSQKVEIIHKKHFPKPFLVEEVHLKDISGNNSSQNPNSGKTQDYQKLPGSEFQGNSFTQMQKQNLGKAQEYQKLSVTELKGNSFNEIQKQNSGKMQAMSDIQSVSSGRESSMSISSTVSDTCSLSVSIDSADSSSEFSNNIITPPLKTKPSIGRALRQDLHQYLLKPDDSSKPQNMQQGVTPGHEKSKKVDTTGRTLIVNKKAEKIHLPTTKPLPMEPIRRVDLGPSCLRPLPLEKESIRNSLKDSLLTRKVPQAIVAPFQRFPPQGEKSLGDQLMHMHRVDVSNRTEMNTPPVIDTYHPTVANREEASQPVTSVIADQATTETSQIIQQPSSERLQPRTNVASPSTSRTRQNLKTDEQKESNVKEKSDEQKQTNVNEKSDTSKLTSLRDFHNSAIASTSCTVLQSEVHLTKKKSEPMQTTTIMSSPGASKTRQSLKIDLQNEANTQEKRNHSKDNALQNVSKTVSSINAQLSKPIKIPSSVSCESSEVKIKHSEESGRTNFSLRSKDKKKEEQLETRTRRSKMISNTCSEKNELRPKRKPSTRKSGEDDFNLSKIKKCQVDVAILNNSVLSSRLDQPDNITLGSVASGNKIEIVDRKLEPLTNELVSPKTDEKLKYKTTDSDSNPNLEKIPKEPKEINSSSSEDKMEPLPKEMVTSILEKLPLFTNKTDSQQNEEKEITNKIASSPSDEKIESLTNEMESPKINEQIKQLLNKTDSQPTSKKDSPQNEDNSKVTTDETDLPLNEETKLHSPLNEEIKIDSPEIGEIKIDSPPNENNEKVTANETDFSLNKETNQTLILTKKRKRKANKTGFPSKNKKKKMSYSILREKVERKKQVREKSLPSSVTPLVRPMRECKKEKEQSKTDTESKASEDNSSSLKRPSNNEVMRKIIKPLQNKDLKEAHLNKAAVNQDSLTETLTNIFKNRVFNKKEEDGNSTDTTSMSLYEPSDNDRDTALPMHMSESNSSEPPSGAEELETHHARKRKKVGHGTKEKFRKMFMKAGLFSYDFKMDSAPSSDNESKQSVVYKTEEHPHSLLPPPYYCGRQLRQKKDDFQLPHDLWFLHKTNQLPVRDVAATWNYKKIKNNIYYDVSPVKVYESPACHCKRPSDETAYGCEYNSCINRMTYTECDPESCPIADRCSNMGIQKHAAIQSLERFMTEDKGFGLRTRTFIRKGTFIMEYVGEVVSDKEFKRRMFQEYQHDTHHYCMHIDGGMVIDGHRMGGECRFVNHSCKPNCEMQKWSVGGTYRMGLFPKRNIEADEELTYDYNFSLFNPHEGQICRCASVGCRGIIGGKTQRVQLSIQNTKSSESRTSQQDKSKEGVAKMNKNIRKNENNKTQVPQLVTIKPLSLSQQQFCRYNQIFLLRNLEKVRKLREAMLRKDPSGPIQPAIKPEETTNVNKVEDMIKTSMTAITTARTTQTRCLAIAQDHPDVAKVAKLAKFLQEMFTQLMNVKDPSGSFLSHHLQPPSKKINSVYWQIIEDPIDLDTIERGINIGSYSSVIQFDSDLRLLLQNNLRFYGSLSLQGQATLSMKTHYKRILSEASSTLSEVAGEKDLGLLLQSEPSPTIQEEIIRCPCGQYKDEGVMVECEQCGVWQHTDCVQPGVDLSQQESFLCEQCGDHTGILDIPLIPQPEYACPGETYFSALQREDGMKVCLGDTVYVLRAFEEEGTSDNANMEGRKCMEVGGIPHKVLNPMKGPSRQAASLLSGNYPTYRTVSADISTGDMDIFRVERLWKNETGDHFAFGHHYLRPHETFHEPSRKFFYNEVFRVPLYEVLPLDTIWRKSWVMDPVTYSRGRPKGAQEEHVYICEYRVDKTSRLFNKILKPKYPVFTKSYAFDQFDQKLKITRAFTPHQVPDKWTRASRPKTDVEFEDGTATKKATNKKNKPTINAFYNNSAKLIKKKPIDAVLRNLLEIQGDKDPIDATYLLEPPDKRQRNKNCIMHSKL